jgi:predicted transcriptional regulator
MTKIMAKQPSYQPTEAELEILKVVWELEPASVRAIHERIAAGKGVGYTTVLKQIQRLTEKGVLEKEITEGIHLYRASVHEADVKQGLVDKVLNGAFGGSAVQMAMHALGNQKTSPEELQELKNWLDQQLSDK